MRAPVRLLFCVLMVTFGVSGQTPASPADAPQPANQASAISKDRLFFALPNFLTLENADEAPALTPGEKSK